MNVSGHRISTAEVESALVSHPAVAESAVVGTADDTTGQAIAAFVVLRNGNEHTVDEQLASELRLLFSRLHRTGSSAAPAVLGSCC